MHDVRVKSAPRVKGLSLRNAVDALVALHGPEALERALLRTPEEIAVLVRQGRNAALLRAIDESTPGGRELMQRLGRHSNQAGSTREAPW